MNEIVCIGIAVVDLITEGVKKIPENGKLELIDNIKMYTGGCAINVAIDLAKLGESVGIISLIGEDGMGAFLTANLQEAGVNISGLKTTSAIGTSASVVLISEKGERSFLHTPGANKVFQEHHITWDLLENTKILVIAGSLLMETFDGAQTAKVLKEAQSRGIYTVLDTAWDSTGKWFEKIGPCLPYLDLFIPSIEEAIELSGYETEPKIADFFLSHGVKNVVIKLGKTGCFFQNNEKSFYSPSYQVVSKDTTGAGDSFVAGFVTGLNNDWPVEKCADFANCVGAFCVKGIGASTNIPTKEVALDYINKNYRQIVL